MERERKVDLPEGMREPDRDYDLYAKLDRLVAAIDACRACPSRQRGLVCDACVLEDLDK